MILGWWRKLFSSPTGYDFKEGSVENWCLGLSKKKKGRLNKDFCYDARSLFKGCTRPANSIYLRQFPYLRCFGWTESGAVFVACFFRCSGGTFVSVRLFGGRRGRRLGIPLPFLGCRMCCGCPRDCAWVQRCSGPAPTWVPRPGVLFLVVL